MHRLLVAVAPLVAVVGCYRSHEPPGDPACGDEPPVLVCDVRGVWIFPVLTCNADVTVAIGLCAGSRAVRDTLPPPPSHEPTEGTWSMAASSTLVSVDLPDADLSFEWFEADDMLFWRDIHSCAEPTGYRAGDERLAAMGWHTDWPVDLCAGSDE